MDIKQVKSDFDKGIMLSRVTVGKLIEAAEIMHDALTCISRYDGESPAGKAIQEDMERVDAL